MIIRETPSSFIYIAQHDHAQVSGVLAAQWAAPYFKGVAWRAEVELAIQQHDRGWIFLDAAPIWNEQAQAPHSFLDYPALPKIRHYQQGIDEVEQMAPYAGLLCSLHYTGFPDLSRTEAGGHFLTAEAHRQQRLKRQLGLTTSTQEEELEFHLQLLKFTDRLSLYLCLNEPGATKTQEHPWYKEGIPFSDFFGFTRGRLIQAAWTNKDRVQLRPSPFADAFPIELNYRELPKVRLTAVGLPECFEEAPIQKLNIKLL